jgi:hypothetical protein
MIIGFADIGAGEVAILWRRTGRFVERFQRELRKSR